MNLTVTLSPSLIADDSPLPEPTLSPPDDEGAILGGAVIIAIIVAAMVLLAVYFVKQARAKPREEETGDPKASFINDSISPMLGGAEKSKQAPRYLPGEGVNPLHGAAGGPQLHTSVNVMPTEAALAERGSGPKRGGLPPSSPPLRRGASGQLDMVEQWISETAIPKGGSAPGGRGPGDTRSMNSTSASSQNPAEHHAGGGARRNYAEISQAQQQGMNPLLVRQMRTVREEDIESL